MPLTCRDVEDRAMQDITKSNVELFYRLLTEADERLLQSGKWQWTRTGIDLVPVNGEVTIPSGYESIVGAKIGSIGAGVSWQEVQYMEGNAGILRIEGCQNGLVDKGLISGIRTYEIIGGGEVNEVVALVRFAPRLLSSPDDLPVCQNISALKQMMLGIVYENNNDIEKSMQYTSLAIRTLDQQESAYRGAARKIRNPKLFEPARRRSRHNFP